VAAALDHPTSVRGIGAATRSRLSITFGVALALHGLTALVGYQFAAAPAIPFVEGPPLIDTEIELVDLPAPPRGTDDVDLRQASASELAPSSEARMREYRAHRTANISPDSAPVLPSRDSRGAPSLELGGAEGSYALNPSAEAKPGGTQGAAIELGIGAGDWSRWVDPTASPTVKREGRAAFVAPPPVSSTGGLAEALEARDHSIGLGPAGAVLTAVHDAGYSEIAPSLGTATFSITVLRSGDVDVRLTGASSQAAEWVKMGESIAAAIRRKPPRISEARSGVRLGIEVVAEERWPNGQATRLDSGPKFALTPPPKVQAVETAKQSLLDRNPAAVPDPDAPSGKPRLQANVEAPGIGVQGRGKVCNYKIGLYPMPGIYGGCDPTNIGAKARRVVSTRVTSQTMF
jgi:hypothetical protein